MNNFMTFVVYIVLLSALPCHHCFAPGIASLSRFTFYTPCNQIKTLKLFQSKNKESDESNVKIRNHKHQEPHRRDISLVLQRRDLFRRTISSSLLLTAVSTTSLTTPILVKAAEPAAEQLQAYNRVRSDKQGNKFGYTLSVSPSLEPSNKPLQTHLDEVNLMCPNIRGYQYGITVDMIRIKNLREFGTPEEVGAKIVMAELRRDGVLDVTMASDASEDAGTGAYDVEYISDGTRGKKHFFTRTVVKDGKLFVLTAQIKEGDLEDGLVKKDDIWDSVRSFRVLNPEEM